eukprot:4639527-Prorocentrum_lima.AAC.1
MPIRPDRIERPAAEPRWEPLDAPAFPADNETDRQRNTTHNNRKEACGQATPNASCAKEKGLW